VPDESPTLWIVDGDNVAHVRGGADDYEQVRAGLVTAAVDHAARSGISVVLVFDGHGRETAVGTTRIRFAGSETADTVIERLAHRSQHDHDVTVISSDTVLRHVAQRGGVQAMSAREYVDRLGAAPSAEAPSTPAARQRFTVAESVDDAVRDALERLRRGQ
jgi:predicted RNA-binding protein with PIN domain